MGIVFKENFDAEEDSKFHLDSFATEKRENATLKERREREEKSKDDSLKAYEEWLQLKSMRESALKYLGLVIPPVLIVSSREMGIGIAGGGGGGSMTSSGNTLDTKDEGIAIVIEVNYIYLSSFERYQYPSLSLYLYLFFSLILFISSLFPFSTVSFPLFILLFLLISCSILLSLNMTCRKQTAHSHLDFSLCHSLSLSPYVSICLSLSNSLFLSLSLSLSVSLTLFLRLSRSISLYINLYVHPLLTNG